MIPLLLFSSVEPVEIVYPDNTIKTYPQLEPRKSTAKIDYINSCTGLDLPGEEICRLLNRMSLDAKMSAQDSNEVVVNVPCTRWDILHACDIMEDVAISYGYDNLPKKMPNVNTFASALPLNKLSDHVRKEVAMAGFSEVAPLILVSVSIRSSAIKIEEKTNCKKILFSALMMKISSSSTVLMIARQLFN